MIIDIDNGKLMMKTAVYCFFLMIFSFPLLAQETDLHGIIRTNSSLPLKEVHVWLVNTLDTTQYLVTKTESNGTFHFPSVRKATYRFEASAVGYQKLFRVIQITDPNADLGIFTMIEAPINIGEMVIKGRTAPAIQKGDTTELNANAFKTHPDATTEELLTKMPGVVVSPTGTVQAGGETVQRVLVDGKPFFGDDPTLAIRNLPAEVVEKIQVFDQMSEQAQFTGFDDGQYTKTMNIVTRHRNTPAQFGKFTTGYGEDERYGATGGINIFDGNTRISLLGSFNNTNQQDFSTQDLLGVLSGNSQQSGFGRSGSGRNRQQGNGPRGGTFTPGSTTRSGSNLLIGQPQGINNISMLGTNVTDSLTGDIFLHGNYFFNRTGNQNNQTLNRQYILAGDSSSRYDQQSDNTGTNFNHRVNARLDYAVDSSNSISFIPQLYFQNNNSSSIFNAINTDASGVPLLQSNSSNQTTTSGNNIGGHLVLRHKFETVGRTISLDINISESLKQSSGNLDSKNIYNATTIDSSSLIDQHSGGTTRSISVTPSLVYTEPLGSNSLLQINYAPTISRGTADKRTYDLDTTNQKYSIFNPALSNTYETRYTTQRSGIGYRYYNQKTNLSFGVAYQRADLWSNETYPVSSDLSKNFSNILPNAMLNLKLADHENLRVYYQTSTRAPAVTQLQNVVDNSNPLLLTAGNPNLQQSYTHSLSARYSLTTPEAGKSMFLFVSANRTMDYIGNATLTANRDTMFTANRDTVHLSPGTQMTVPQNFDRYWSLRSFFTYGFPFDLLSSTLNLNAGASYTNTPGTVNSALSFSHTSVLSGGFVIGSNISTNLDFTVSYMGNYNINRITLQPQLNSDYYSHTASLRFNWIFLEGIVFRSDVSNTYNNGLSSGYNQNSMIWNMSLAKKLFDKQSGEIKLSVTDLLGQNKSISRTVTSSYVEDDNNQVLTRYVMLTFMYTLR